jgi:hypothetical protein|tara:strand:+ start:1212 stop:1739 length:528 start_codon:yes stop_codon:yes gene_type:complete
MALTIKIKIAGKPVEKILLKAKKTLDGNIIISDHPDMSILILPAQSKVVSLAKEQLDDELYDSQKRMFDFLTAKGVVSYDSVQDGAMFMSREANIPEVSGEGDKIQYCLYAISNFIEKELPFYKNMEDYEKEVEDNLLDPEVDEYTEFDSELHNDTKGSLPPRFVKYGIHSIYRI